MTMSQSKSAQPPRGLRGENQTLIPCKICGRKFTSEALQRHEPICRKLFKKKRPVFNSFKQRARGIPLRMSTAPSKYVPKKSTWREQHTDLITSLRSAKLAIKAMKEGRPLPPPPPPSLNPDYIQCPYCGRRFNENAAARHISFCKDQAARQVMVKPSPQATAKSLSRMQPRQRTAVSQMREASKASTVGAGPSSRSQASAGTSKFMMGSSLQSVAGKNPKPKGANN
ncbi:zinc finger C2HC domain-containing protein 1B [Ambystoma mexicanum]|uniref:zinc finger C2HC domain-containing protein 1B n=1 Tax=Ambystoma mexicanum TaxID=8296 RepID=UPI0037E7E8EC